MDALRRAWTAFRRWPIWAQLATAVVIVAVVASAVGGGETEGGGGNGTASDRCEDVSADVIDSLAEGLEGETPGDAAAVRSDDFEKVWFYGVEVGGQVGVWSSNTDPSTTDILEIRGFFSINDHAQSASDWGAGDTTDANITMSDDGATEAEECVSGG